MDTRSGRSLDAFATKGYRRLAEYREAVASAVAAAKAIAVRSTRRGRGVGEGGKLEITRTLEVPFSPVFVHNCKAHVALFFEIDEQERS